MNEKKMKDEQKNKRKKCRGCKIIANAKNNKTRSCDSLSYVICGEQCHPTLVLPGSSTPLGAK